MADKIKATIDDLIEDMKIKQQNREEGGYDERIDTLLDDLYGTATEGFKYDAEADPNYQAAVKDYNIEADRTMRDVLGQGAARTGGIASTSAIAAASQARDYRMSGLADTQARLYNNALARHEAEVGAKYQILEALENLEDDERNDYLSLLSMRESIDDSDREDARSQIQNMIALGMVPGEDLVAASGWEPAYVNQLQSYAARSMDTLQVQQLLNSMGADLSPDGVWGERTEAWYQKLFGAPSGRQQSTMYTPSYNPGYTPSPTPQENPQGNNSSEYNEAFAVIKSGFADGSLSTNEAIAAINDLYNRGKITESDRNYLISYAQNYNRKR